ncbi:MAG: leucine-rich repeat domain-containing protein [Proteobacteria bacterium]|nr:leucine-rich repeat domain-containing protein [Pseudomonadota bacterium]
MADHGPSEFGKILGSLLNALGKKIQESVEQASRAAEENGSGRAAEGKLGPLNYHIEFKVQGDKDKRAKGKHSTRRQITAADAADALDIQMDEDARDAAGEGAVDEAALRALDAFFGAAGEALPLGDTGPDFDCLGSLLIRYTGKKKVVVVPDGVETIGPGAFEDVDSMCKVVLPESVTAIEARAFQSCISLKEIVFPKNLALIAEEAFAGCISLETLELPESVAHIENGAFSRCRSLREIALPAGLRHMPSRLFRGCAALQVVHYGGTPETAGSQFFDEVSPRNLEKFCYFEKNDAGDIVRIESDTNPFMDGGAFAFGRSPYVASFSRTLQNFILSNVPWNLKAVSDYAEMSEFALKLAGLLSGGELYSSFHVVRLCVGIMQSISDGSIAPADLKAYAAGRVMDLIGGSGAALEALDGQLARMASPEISILNGVSDATSSAFAHEMLRQLEVEITPYRYHPGIYHCCARVLKNSSYWEFLTCLEGLMRGRRINIDAVSYRPEPDEDMDGWCRAWSLALEAHKLSVVRISEPAVFGGMDDVIALLGDADALELKKLFEAHGIGFPVKVYSAGRDAVGLRLV